jgi:hypothetical protein
MEHNGNGVQRNDGDEPNVKHQADTPPLARRGFEDAVKISANQIHSGLE